MPSRARTSRNTARRARGSTRATSGVRSRGPPPRSWFRSDPTASEAATRLTFRETTTADVRAVVALRTSTARDLTKRFGRGHWSGEPTERGARYDMRISRVWLVRSGRAVVATFRLSTRKPWAIDRSYFTACEHPIYLTDMSVRPDYQRRGVGRGCIDEIVRIARRWPAEAIRLDAYDAEAGAGDFYARCGFRHVGNAVYRGVPLVYYEMVLT